MSRPLNEFGGWLRWFYIISWLSLVMLAIAALISLLASNGVNSVESLIYCIDSGIVAFLSFKIIKLIKIQDPMTPNRIIVFMTWILLATALFVIPELWLDYVLNSGKSALEIGKAAVRTVIWYCVWSSYFKKSKRVLAYYGKNADKTSLKS